MLAATWGHNPLNNLEIKASDVQELRNRLNEALAALQIPVLPYFDAGLSTGANGTPLRATHIEQLQARSTRGSSNSSGPPPSISISIGDANVNEGNSGTTSAVFNVTLSSASTQTIGVNYATANGTATVPAITLPPVAPSLSPLDKQASRSRYRSLATQQSSQMKISSSISRVLLMPR